MSRMHKVPRKIIKLAGKKKKDPFMSCGSIILKPLASLETDLADLAAVVAFSAAVNNICSLDKCRLYFRPW